MPIKPFLFGLCSLLLFSGCVEVTFPEAMPMNRCDKNQFPKSWIGDWTFSKQSDDLEENLSIHPQYITSGTDQMVLGEGCILRKFSGYLVLSTKSESSERWNLLFAKRDKDVLHIYNFDGTDKEKAKIWEEVLRESSENGFETVRKNEGATDRVKEYKLNPEDNKTFRQLIKSGGLTHMGDYVR
tara:strand:+ start:635 stop:1186 length:552 start_codon:yes stop_codon:yes gene_type:complete